MNDFGQKLNGNHSTIIDGESPDEIKLVASLVKQLTGGDPLSTGYLHNSFFELDPKFIIHVTTSHVPDITDDTLFTSGRIKVIPFNRHINEID
jgi:putative DNA primase/helicase